MSSLGTLKRILREMDVEIDRRALTRFDTLRTLLLEHNLHTNLTAIRDPFDVEIRLFADSLALLPMIEAERLREGREAMRLIDIGTGAGFPGLPIAIASDAIEVTLVDATRKKVGFIDHAIERLGIHNAQTVHSRSEELAHHTNFRERFDIVTARAVSSLPALVELCLPFVRVGGLALFPKGRDVDGEISDSLRALQVIGGELFDVLKPDTPELNNTVIVCVRKISPSPRKYPRSPGTPARTPL